MENWRDILGVGDRIDVFDNNEWKIGIIQRVVKGDQLMVHLLNEHWKNDLIIKKASGKKYHISIDLNRTN